MITQNVPVPDDRRVWNELTALREAGYEVTVISPLGSGTAAARFQRLDGIDIHRYPQTTSGGGVLGYIREYCGALWHIRRLARRLSRERAFDVVHASNPPDFLLPAVHFLRRGGSRMIFDHHDLTPELFAVRFGRERGLAWRVTLMLERLTYHLADAVVATNESYRRVAIDRGRKRAEDVFVVRSDPELSRFRLREPEPELRHGRRHLISFIGRIEPQDGVDHAVRALGHLAQRRSDWHAVIAGEGGVLPELRRLTAALGLEEQIEYPGWLHDADLQRLLSTSDVCLVPDPKTPLSDASTLVKVAEYMAMARPIVAYDLTETRITAGAAALYARADDPEDLARAIDELLDDPERRAEMGRIGRERTEQSLSWDNSKVQLLAAYSAVLTVERPGRI
jgi:glycosyltransferase involved in cell wall biosynthesis